MENLTIQEIANLPVIDRQEDGVEVVRLPDGEVAYRVPKHSENGNGWWAGETLVYRLFENIELARQELAGK